MGGDIRYWIPFPLSCGFPLLFWVQSGLAGGKLWWGGEVKNQARELIRIDNYLIWSFIWPDIFSDIWYSLTWLSHYIWWHLVTYMALSFSEAIYIALSLFLFSPFPTRIPLSDHWLHFCFGSTNPRNESNVRKRILSSLSSTFLKPTPSSSYSDYYILFLSVFHKNWVFHQR